MPDGRGEALAAYHRRVTNEATHTDHSAAGHSCAHCDAAEDHHALDEKGIVDSYRSALNSSGIVRALIAVALLASALLWAPLAILAGIGGWIVATSAGLLAVSLLQKRYGTPNSVVLGTVASAALVPVAAWGASTWIGASPTAAIAAASGWFGALAVVEYLRDRKLSALLIADSRDAEAARHGVLFGNPVSPWAGLGWSAFTAALFGLWVWVIGMLPLAVLPLIPLQVVLALLSRKSTK